MQKLGQDRCFMNFPPYKIKNSSGRPHSFDFSPSIHLSITPAISSLFISRNIMCPLPLTPASPRSMCVVALTPACFRNAAIHQSDDECHEASPFMTSTGISRRFASCRGGGLSACKVQLSFPVSLATNTLLRKSVAGSTTGGSYVTGISVSPHGSDKKALPPAPPSPNGGPDGSNATIACTSLGRTSAITHG